MPFAKFHVNPSVWSWVLQYGSSALSPRLLHDIHIWSTTKKSPNIHQILIISKLTDISFGYFFLAKPMNNLYDLHFDNLKFSLILPQNIQHLLFHLNLKANWLDWYEVTHPWLISKLTNIKLALTLCRTHLVSFNYFRHMISDNGIPVLFYSHLPNNDGYSYLDPNYFKGCTIIHDKCRIICINRNCSGYEQLKTLLSCLFAVQDYRQIYIKDYSSSYTHKIGDRASRYLRYVDYCVRPVNNQSSDRNFVLCVDNWLFRSQKFIEAYDLLDLDQSSGDLNLLNKELHIKTDSTGRVLQS